MVGEPLQQIPQRNKSSLIFLDSRCQEWNQIKNWCRRRDLNPHAQGHWLLRPACLPFHHCGTEGLTYNVSPLKTQTNLPNPHLYIHRTEELFHTVD